MITYDVTCKDTYKTHICAKNANDAITQINTLKLCPYTHDGYALTKTTKNNYEVKFRLIFNTNINTDNIDIAKREASKLCPFECHTFEFEKIEN